MKLYGTVIKYLQKIYSTICINSVLYFLCSVLSNKLKVLTAICALTVIITLIPGLLLLLLLLPPGLASLPVPVLRSLAILWSIRVQD